MLCEQPEKQKKTWKYSMPKQLPRNAYNQESDMDFTNVSNSNIIIKNI